MAQPKSKPERGKIKRIVVEPGKTGGFTVEHHFQQEMGGGGMASYKEPETHVMADHGELLNHLHEHMGDHDESEACPCCAASDTAVKKGKGGKTSPSGQSPVAAADKEKVKKGGEKKGLGHLAKY
jgi:hypothetical protein